MTTTQWLRYKRPRFLHAFGKHINVSHEIGQCLFSSFLWAAKHFFIPQILEAEFKFALFYY